MSAQPDGWVSVPREPTRAMLAAGICAVIETKRITGSDSGVADSVYRAMLAAAPKEAR